MKLSFKQVISIGLTVSMFSLNAVQSQAMLAPAAGDVILMQRSQDLQTVQSFLEQKQVAQHLATMPLSSSEISTRLGNLSDQELHNVATRIQYERPAADGGGVIVTVLVIGILALLFVYLLKRV